MSPAVARLINRARERVVRLAPQHGVLPKAETCAGRVIRVPQDCGSQIRLAHIPEKSGR
jgi:hypothetical protein